ncbi:MAG: hypothetical protein GX483_02780 [Actinomycetaceae bacterium]|nr:hypothetical protein [Actinomycetaceae bacterium]
MTSISSSRTNLAGLVRRTISALENADLPLDMPGSIELRESRRQLLTQLQARILPHLESNVLPAIIVFGGSSGAGKSTLVNSLVGQEISPASVLRPTTRTPVIVLHPSDEAAMSNHALKDFGTYQVLDTAIPGVALVDAPDLDSVEAENRELSARLLDAADLWMFVTTASRYGDALAWNTLEMAHQRGITSAVVLDRVPQRAAATVRTDLLKRMAQVGIAESPLFIVPDAGAHSGLLEDKYVAEIRHWLEVISATKVGNSLVERTTQATLPALRENLLRLADALESQEHALLDLKDKAREAVHAPLDKLATNIAHGRFGQGAPTASWLAFASTGGPLAGLVAGRKPHIFERNTTRRDNATTSIFESIHSAVRVAVTQGVLTGQAAVEEAWKNDVVDTTELLATANANADTDAIIDDAVQGWKADVAQICKKVSPNPWLGPAGIAALVGIAAGGIAGANTTARSIGLENVVEEARTALSERVRGALNALADVYANAAGAVHVGDSSDLRLRASEFLAHS